MTALNDIKKNIEPELIRFEALFQSIDTHSYDFVNQIIDYSKKLKGKQIRPMLVLLSAKLCGEVNEKTHYAAGMLEMLHLSSLIHDDVVDFASERRGMPSVNVIWTNKIAVLSGDFLFSKIASVCSRHLNLDFFQIVSDTMSTMSEAELLQIKKEQELDFDEDLYFNIIEKKTASLLAACCYLGALSVDADAECCERLRLYGTYLGIIFQLRDDIFDFQPDNVSGKPVGSDVKSHNITLPLIYTLKHCNETQRAALLNAINNSTEDENQISFLIQEVDLCGGIAYTQNKMDEYAQKAQQILDGFKDSSSKGALREMLDYVINRNI